ncbi:hypothetical protein ES703_97415 [subsurface metagenome]
MDGNCEIFFGVFLANYILVQIFFYFSGFGHILETDAANAGSFAVLLDDVVAQLDTFRTNIDFVGALYKRVSLTRRSAAETANRLFFGI